jgi:hypothetical protein
MSGTMSSHRKRFVRRPSRSPGQSKVLLDSHRRYRHRLHNRLPVKRVTSSGRLEPDFDRMHVNSRFLCVVTAVCFAAHNASEALITVQRVGTADEEDGGSRCVSTTAGSGVGGNCRALCREACDALKHHGLSWAHGAGSVHGAGHRKNDCAPRKTITRHGLCATGRGAEGVLA